MLKGVNFIVCELYLKVKECMTLLGENNIFILELHVQ